MTYTPKNGKSVRSSKKRIRSSVEIPRGSTFKSELDTIGDKIYLIENSADDMDIIESLVEDIQTSASKLEGLYHELEVTEDDVDSSKKSKSGKTKKVQASTFSKITGFRSFTESDWQTYSGAESFVEDPLIFENDLFVIIADGRGVTVEFFNEEDSDAGFWEWFSESTNSSETIQKATKTLHVIMPQTNLLKTGNVTIDEVSDALASIGFTLVRGGEGI